MSRGLGRVQRRILEELQISHDKDCSWWNSTQDLVAYVFHPERFEKNRDPKPDVWLPYEYTRSEYVSLDRAIRTLEQRELIETKVEPYRWSKSEGWNYYYGRRCKQVRISEKGLSVDL